MTQTYDLGYSYDSLRSSLRGWLQGSGYYNAVWSMDECLKLHTGFRKDGKTPEFYHQVFQASLARTLVDRFMFPEEVFCTIFWHDGPEDHTKTAKEFDKMRSRINVTCGLRVHNAVVLMTDCYSDRTPKGDEFYFASMADDPIASLAKGLDRIHNHQSMGKVFSPAKQMKSIEQTRRYILPMLKKARKNFPRQEPAYQNIKHILLTQMDLISAMHQSS
jgi:hypothetical protein